MCSWRQPTTPFIKCNMIRGTTLPPRRIQKTPDIGELFAGFHGVPQLKHELEQMMLRHEEEHNQKLQELDAAIANALKIQKGDKPIAGVDYPIPKNGKSVDHHEVVADVLKKIPPPSNGKDAVVDYKKVAKLAVQLLPKANAGKSVDENTIIKKVIGALTSGKTKLHIKHVEGFKEGLEQTLAPIRHLAAGNRGGGDTIAAGSNVTVSVVNGVKVISATAGASTILAATGSVDNSNLIFTFASTPQMVVVNGSNYRNGHGVAIVGVTATLDSPVGTGGDIYGIS